MSRLAAVEGDLETAGRLQGQLEDLETLNQLALEEDDDSVGAELTQGLADLAGAVEDLEVLALLGGEFDDRDAIVTIHPGAGAPSPRTGPRCSGGCCTAGPSGAASR
jgi:peptide chain release factor 2